MHEPFRWSLKPAKVSMQNMHQFLLGFSDEREREVVREFGVSIRLACYSFFMFDSRVPPFAWKGSWKIKFVLRACRIG